MCTGPNIKELTSWFAKHDTLVSVTLMSNAVVQLFLTLREMPTARGAVGTEILQTALQA